MSEQEFKRFRPCVINSNFCKMIKQEIIHKLTEDEFYTDKTDVSVIAGYTLEPDETIKLMVLIDNTPLIELAISPYTASTFEVKEKIFNAYKKKYRALKFKKENEYV